MAQQALVSSLCRKVRFKFEARAKEDILATLENFRDLQPEVRKHVFPDKVERMSLCLHGTIPINYKVGARGLLTLQNNVYNIPVALYLLDNHPYAGPYCYVCPTENMQIRASKVVDSKGQIYLPYLTEWQYPRQDTTGLLQVMTCEFQEKSPVFSTQSSRPAQPPYPAQAEPFPRPQQTPYPAGPAPGMPSATPYPQQPAYSAGYQPPYQPFLPATAESVSNTPNGNYGFNSIGVSPIRASLSTAVDEKLRDRLKELMGTPYAELQSIDVNSQELRAGNQKLRDMLESMERERQRLDEVKCTYEEKKKELTKALDGLRSSNAGGSESVDDAIDAASPLHRQILACYAEDCAIDDTIYALGQALRRGSLTLPVYLKLVRQLSRKQFCQRATLQKGRLAAGLPV